MPFLRWMRSVMILFAAGIATAAHAELAYEIAAQRDYEATVLRLRMYRNAEYPQRLRHLEAEMKLSDAEIAELRRRLRDYEPFQRFSTGNPLPITTAYTRIALQETQRYRREVREAYLSWQRYHADRMRLLELDVAAAQARVLETGDNTVSRAVHER